MGMGWEWRIKDIFKAFTLRPVLDVSESRKLRYCSLEHGNGRCPGCDISQPKVYLWNIFCFLFSVTKYGTPYGDSVYSYWRGLWRCLFDCNRQCESLDTWNGQQDDSTLFYVMFKYKPMLAWCGYEMRNMQ